MIARIITALGGKLLTLSAPVLAWAALGVLAAFVGLSGTIAVQSWRIDNLKEREDRAATLLDVCKSANSGLSERITEIDERNRINIETLRDAAVRADRTAKQAQAEREALESDLESELERIRSAAVGDVCADVQSHIGWVLNKADY